MCASCVFIRAERVGEKVATYGAAAKGNTLLNFCGVKNDLTLNIMFVKHNG
ncbi:MAG: hypothetical protein KOO65_05730 [Desulfobacterales bacterium]|nr:hypothetical protein [Desulfobacterales bacterium]